VPDAPSASIVIPTQGRPDYLRTALASVVPQAERAGAEVLVVVQSDADSASASVARSGGAILLHSAVSGANAARNAGIRATLSDLVVLIDDDIEAPAGWLAALLDGVARTPDSEVFGGPIRARLEGGGPRSCGREGAPITTLDCGPEDRDVPLVWSANMAIRRSALERVGEFDETLHGRGEEEDWQRRHAAQGGLIRYLAAAGLDHRRTATDARLGPLTRGAYHLGRSARRYDVRKGSAPGLGAEVRTLAGCAWHVGRRRCANGIILGGHAAGRLREALSERAADTP
jgi:GT2 family glycosyltransferase